MRLLVKLAGGLFLVVLVYGYFRSDDPGFKLQCAVYQTNVADTLSFPDKTVCLTFYQLKN